MSMFGTQPGGSPPSGNQEPSAFSKLAPRMQGWVIGIASFAFISIIVIAIAMFMGSDTGKEYSFQTVKWFTYLQYGMVFFAYMWNWVKMSTEEDVAYKDLIILMGIAFGALTIITIIPILWSYTASVNYQVIFM